MAYIIYIVKIFSLRKHRVIFRFLLLIMWLALFVYTAIVSLNHGLGLLPIFFGDIGQITWPGQFNLDFLFMLILSASWVYWRHRFSAKGFALAVLALFGGASFLCLYLFILSLYCKGDVHKMLLGK